MEDGLEVLWVCQEVFQVFSPAFVHGEWVSGRYGLGLGGLTIGELVQGTLQSTECVLEYSRGDPS